MEKAEARGYIGRAIAALSPDERTQKSEAVARRLMALPEYQRAGVVMYFIAMEDEIDTLGLVTAALRTGKRVACPKVDAKRRLMEAHEITDPGEQLRPGHYGIPEPVTRRIVPVDAFDFILVPARGFDVRGHRLGRGAGYYDRYLSQPGCRAIKCGIAFDVQVIDDLPYDDDDVPVDIVLTESRTLRRG